MKKVLSLVCLLAIVATCLFVLASCGGGTPNLDGKQAMDNLKANGYTIMSGSINDEGVGQFYAISDDLEDAIQIYYAATEADAQAAYDRLMAGENEDNIETGISGKVVWAGTSGAISATK